MTERLRRELAELEQKKKEAFDELHKEAELYGAPILMATEIKASNTTELLRGIHEHQKEFPLMKHIGTKCVTQKMYPKGRHTIFVALLALFEE